jgi:polyisoprenyl-phosphate glycosyltransferase
MKLSIVIPVYNEEKALPPLKQRLAEIFASFTDDYEIVFIDDGSQDNGAKLIESWIKEDGRVILVSLSRNFGHQAAITAGLQESSGDAVIIMDADLQDPPELIPEMYGKWQQGYKVVLAERAAREESLPRRILFGLFYKIFYLLSDFPVSVNSGVFGLMDRTVVSHLLQLTEQNRFLPGLRGWVGFKTTVVQYKRSARSVGTPNQSFMKLFKYGFDAIFSFSYKPLRFSFVLGSIVSAFSFTYGAILVVKRLLNIDVVPGFTTVAVALFFVGGVILMSNGVIGEYLARIYDEVKRRPLYIVERKVSRKVSGDIKVEDHKNSLRS